LPRPPQELVALRDAWLNPPDLPEKELQKRTLTNLYNAAAGLAGRRARRLDAAVFAAYGWPEDLAMRRCWRGCWR
jgi:hypothetical protein